MKLSAIIPPPASAAGPIHCAGCGARNSAQRKHCGKCGKHLWDPCMNCGQTNSAEEEFCGGCGTNLKAALSKTADRIDKDIAQARFLMNEYRFADAISLLRPITTSNHSRLAPLANRANALFEQCIDRQQDLTSRIQRTEEEIKSLIAAGDVDRAAEMAGEIPDALRARELCDLIKEFQQRQAETAELSRTVAQIDAGSLTVDLVAKIERLLVLQPDHSDALRLAQAIRRGAIRKSKRLTNVGDYEKAAMILEQVPEAFGDGEFQKCRERIGDLAYLAWDIQHAPLVDKTLFEYARRLCRHLPENSELKGLCKELERQAAGFRPITKVERSWARPPSAPLLGAPLEFLTGLRPVQIGQKADTAALAENPGRFAVACGLALQGLGRAPLQINLLPERPWLGKIGRWLPKRKAQAAWGIEISSSGLKAVKLTLQPGGNDRAVDNRREAVFLEQCRLIEHRRWLHHSPNTKDRDSVLDETLQRFLKEASLGSDPVIVGLPDWIVLFKTVELPPMPATKREQAVAHEARHLFSAPLPDVAWKHARLDAADEETQKRPFSVAYIGVRQSMLNQFLNRAGKLGLNIAAVQCDMLALYNFAMSCRGCESHRAHIEAPLRQEPVGTEADRPKALIDLGSDRLNILICSPRRIWHRSVMFGSGRINKTLVREFKLTHSQAEGWKRDPTTADSPGNVYEVLQPVYEEYFQETLDSLAAYHKAFPDEPVGSIMACGGGFAAHELPRYFLWRR